MLKNETSNAINDRKQGSKKSSVKQALSGGLNRRAFLKTGAAASLIAGLGGCKPKSLDKAPLKTNIKSPGDHPPFNQAQRATLAAVQLQLFPDDGNGPSAQDLNALNYLENAMRDPKNIDDGDPEKITNGIGWLDDLAEQTQGDQFIALNNIQRDKVLRQIAKSRAGENWLSLLLYYLTEALALDPIYGGNPDAIGWQWLEHQPGFPRPVAGKTYKDFI